MQMFICLKPRSPYLPPRLTLYSKCTCIRVNSILNHTGKGGMGVSWTRGKGRGATVHKAGSKILTWLTDCISSLWTLINTCREVPLPVLRIHDILGWIRIWIRGSMPLTNESGSGCGSGSCYFRHWPSQDANKKLFLKKIFAYYFFKVLAHHFQR